MTPRRCQPCHGPRRPRLLQPSERPPLTCRSRPTPRGLVEFYSWWTVVERVGPVAIRSAPPSTAGISGAVRCDFCGDSSGRVVGAAAPPPRPARRPPAQLRRPPRHLPLRRMQTRRDGSPVGNRPNTRFRPGDARSRHPACADDRMCQGWRSHHVVTSKTPFTQPTGKSATAE
jgi:hypothetical protein